MSMYRDEAHKIFRRELKKKTGMSWSVTGSRGTAYGWTTITSRKERRINHEANPKYITYNETPHIPAVFEVQPAEGEEGWYISEADGQILADAFNMPDSKIHCQGLSISPDSRDFYIDMILDKLQQCERCKNAWIPTASTYCTDCSEIVTRPPAPEPFWLTPLSPPQYKKYHEGTNLNPATHTREGKIKAVKFEILWTEYAALPTGDKPLTFYTWDELHAQMNIIAEHHAVQFGVEKMNCYDKTQVNITYSDGEEYGSRMDIHACSDRDMGTAMLQSLKFRTGEYQPDHLTDEKYQEYLSRVTPESKDACTNFINNYEIKEIPVYPINIESILQDLADDIPEPPQDLELPTLPEETELLQYLEDELHEEDPASI